MLVPAFGNPARSVLRGIASMTSVGFATPAHARCALIDSVSLFKLAAQKNHLPNNLRLRLCQCQEKS